MSSISVVSRHPSRFSCPAHDFPIGIDSEGNEGTKIFKSVYYMTESTCKCQKAKKIGTEISILGAFVALSKLFFTILSSELSFALSRIPSWPVSVFRIESRFVPSRQKPVSTQHYLQCLPLLPNGTNRNKNMSVFKYLCCDLNAGEGAVDQTKGPKCFVSAQMLLSWCTSINGGCYYDKAWCFDYFYSNNNYYMVQNQWKEIPQSTCAWEWHVILILISF